MYGLSSSNQNRARFEALLTPWLDPLYASALRLTRNERNAEDLVQDTVMRAWRFFEKFEKGTNFRAWFFRILTNCYFTKHRREKCRPVTSDLDDKPDLYLYARSAEAGFPTQGPDPAAQLLDKLGTERVVAAIDRAIALANTAAEAAHIRMHLDRLMLEKQPDKAKGRH